MLGQWPQSLPQQFGFVPALRCLTLGKTQLGQSVAITRGLPVAYSGCLAHLPPTEAFSPLSATMRATPAVRALCDCLQGTPARVREMVVVACGEWSMRNPKGSFSTGQCLLAKWAVVVRSQTKPGMVRRRMP